LKIQIRHHPSKRVFDILFSLFFLAVFSPLFFCLAMLVKLSSPGPIFYKSRRMGRGGKVIHCIKFRSMYGDAEERLHTLLSEDVSFRREWEKFQKVTLDPRITPIGHFLRKTSLDELPQFWNVLKGDLSVVGPRPPTFVGPVETMEKEILELYGKRTQTILSVRPGITGLWQISGRSTIPFEERCAMEERYAMQYTLRQDLLVILKTIPAIFYAKGAC